MIKSGGGKTTFEIEFELFEENPSNSAFIGDSITSKPFYKRG